jgi:hypothetical protein
MESSNDDAPDRADGGSRSIIPRLASPPGEGRKRAAPKCSNQTDLRLTLADLFYGSGLPERPSPTSTDLVCIQRVVTEAFHLVSETERHVGDGGRRAS